MCRPPKYIRSVNKDLEITKSIMTHIHLILGNEPEKNHTFNSIQELYDKIDARLEPYDTTEEAVIIERNYYPHLTKTLNG